MKYTSTPAQMALTNDDIQTPEYLAEAIVAYYKPYMSGSVLEPCAGENNIFKYLSEPKNRFEIKEGTDFLTEWYTTYTGEDEFLNTLPTPKERYDWVLTNPPWSKFKDFLRSSFRISDNVVFLVPLNKVFGLKTTLRTLRDVNFGIKDVKLWATPAKPWAQSGFQVGTVWFQRGWTGYTHIELEEY